MVDWNWDLILQVSKVFSILIASGVAIWGINSWRREFRWKLRFEVAEEMMGLLYQIRDSIDQIRSPFYSTSESHEREKLENENPNEKKRKDLEYIGTARINKYQNLFSKFLEKRYKFSAIFGEHHLENFKKIDDVLGEIYASYYVVFNEDYDIDKEYLDEQTKSDFIEQRKKARMVIHKSYGNNSDAISIKVQEVIDVAESSVESILKTGVKFPNV
ncbi:MAG: hypothetical protein AAFY71_16935 [Bacteroidota bacterium]